MSFQEEREYMVEDQLARRGIHDERVLSAFREVPREAFIPPELAEFAYRDTPLPIAEGQTISQPYIVAVTARALNLEGGEKVLEVGTGSGYAAAILARLAGRVYSVERHVALADAARERLRTLGVSNVEVLHGDGTLGWPEHAPYDAIAVAAAAPEVPRALLEQLAPGGRLVIPVGAEGAAQVLMRITREGSGFREEVLSGVRFVPLIGAQGFQEPLLAPAAGSSRPSSISKLIAETAEPLPGPDAASRAVDALLERIGDARLVLLGEATHGTSEFYRMRARITRELIERKGFDFVAVEADWPDAARIDEYVLGVPRRSKHEFTPFERFPSWMWRNREVEAFIHWLREHNAAEQDPRARVGFHGLDLYSMFTSIAAVLAYLDDVDPDAARVARVRYGTLTPWQKDPAAYGRAVLVGRYQSSEEAVVRMLGDLLRRRLEYTRNDGERFFDAAQNARVVQNSERYYRAMYYGSVLSWNLRDQHMFDTLSALLAFHGPNSRGVVWEHNSHIGDASATDMSRRDQLNLGQLCRAKYGASAYLVGFGTDHGSVAAASDWGGVMEKKAVRPAHPESYERLCHDSGVPAFTLHLQNPRRRDVVDELSSSRLERAIGVIYRPETELSSHYFYASLPLQFDEYVWFDETRAVEPLPLTGRPSPDLPETYPFGL